MSDSTRIAVIADVHGNRWALERVLADVRDRGVDEVVNLGDSLYGPLDPRGTARLLRELDPPSVRGNQDRLILEPPPRIRETEAFQRLVSSLTEGDLTWLGEHSPDPIARRDVLFCHGTPERDDAYLAETVGEFGVTLRGPEALAAALGDMDRDLVFCGHSHVPRLLTDARGRTIVNPGSVGLPAYSAATPLPHSMEAGSPHARYAVVRRVAGGAAVEHVAVAYDWDAAAEAAERNGRPDWAGWLRHGRVPPRTSVMGRDREERIGAALAWISHRLGQLGVPFQAAGGLAALAHGAERPLHDLDFYVPEGTLEGLHSELEDHHVHGPRRHRSERWDCYFLELGYAGEAIELAEAGRTRYRRGPEEPWHAPEVDFRESEPRNLFGAEIPVMPRDRLMRYKKRLGRPVDREDLALLEESS